MINVTATKYVNIIKVNILEKVIRVNRFNFSNNGRCTNEGCCENGNQQDTNYRGQRDCSCRPDCEECLAHNFVKEAIL